MSEMVKVRHVRSLREHYEELIDVRRQEVREVPEHSEHPCEVEALLLESVIQDLGDVEGYGYG